MRFGVKRNAHAATKFAVVGRAILTAEASVQFMKARDRTACRGHPVGHAFQTEPTPGRAATPGGPMSVERTYGERLPEGLAQKQRKNGGTFGGRDCPIYAKAKSAPCKTVTFRSNYRWI